MLEQVETNKHSVNTIHSLFEEYVKESPDKIAITFEDLNISYDSLNRQANQLAQFLIHEHKVSPENLVGLCLDRGELIIISILAVLKAGCAYVPISPDYPENRIESILQQTNLKIVFTNKKYKNKLETLIDNRIAVQGTNTKVVALDDLFASQQLASYRDHNPNVLVRESNLAYVITTSGSTGIPKLVMVEHKGAINLRQEFNSKFNLQPHKEEIVVQMASYTFDGLMEELILSLLNGNRLLLIRNQLWAEKNEFYEYLNINKATHIELTPSLAAIYDFTKVPSIKRVEVAGEALTEKCLESMNLKDECTFVNAYGTTETSMVSCIKILKKHDLITVGQAIVNTKLYVLDSNLSPVALGEIGELYISGIGLARGYLGNPVVTAEKFIANPFVSESDHIYSRMYKTGDLVKFLPNGDLSYVGRVDFQVKIRGYRIELEEIEQILLEYSGIKQSAVVALGQENKFLVGYYVADRKLNEADIERHLKAKLPHYMIPAALVHLSKLPLTFNGKLDRNALPKPNFSDVSKYVAPKDEHERNVRLVIAKNLGVSEDNISMEDDFFNLGGNSILLVKLVTEINNLFKVNIKFKEIFNHRTIQNISDHIRNSHDSFMYEDYQIDAADLNSLHEPFNLNNVQQAYLLGRFDNVELGNIATHTYTEYKFEYLNIESLEKSINKLIVRHCALRTVFVDGKQLFLRDVPYYTVKVYELSDESQLLDVRAQFSHKVYEPDIYPLFDIAISKLNDTYILHVSMDALLIDANSVNIFFTELTASYANPAVDLPELTVNYRDYLQQYFKIRTSEIFEKAENYWRDKLKDYNFEANLPLATAIAKIKSPKFSRLYKIVPIHVWNKVVKKIKDLHISPISVILAVYGKVLCHWSNQNKFCINLTLFNRLPLHAQINEIMGDFTVLELFNYSDDNLNTIKEVLKNTHKIFWDDIDNNLFDGIDFQRLIRKEKSISNSQVIAPVVLTSILGKDNKDQDTFIAGDVFIDPSYTGVNYSISQTSQVWLDNQVYTLKDGLVVQWDYVEQLFETDTITAMHDAFCKLIEDLAFCDWDSLFPQISTSVKDLELINKSNTTETTYDYQTDAISGCNDTLFSRYERQVYKNATFNNIAIIDAATESEHTYGQLLNDSESLAKYILSLGAADSKLIGVLCEKGYNQVVSVLSVMKAGQGYLPFNIDWPLARIEEIMEQANVHVLLASKSIYLKKNLSSISEKYTVVIVDELEIDSANIPMPHVTSEDIAYVIFTSGSTGKPKGVTISHKGALNTIDAINQHFAVNYEDKILALSDLSFDLSVYDIFGILAAGATIVFPNQEKIKEPAHWVDLINKHKITIWDTVPQLAELLIDQALYGNELRISSLRLFLLSGDWVPVNLPNKIHAIDSCKNARVISLGGATEASIWSIWYEIDQVKPNWTSIPYGNAMPNQKMYVLNNEQQHAPVGVIGEIHIGGAGLALNYFNDADLTERSFIYHAALGRLYKTGDLGRWHKDGYIEFIGRKDNQVKIRGYRVELEETAIELRKLDEVETAIVKVQKQSGQNYIVAYIVLKQELLNAQNFNESIKQIINKKLSRKLPDYMLPHDYIVIDNLPLTANGKLDFSRLPELDITEQTKYIAPSTNMEKKICNIWSKILCVPEERIGINDNFFDLGGNSLFAMQAITILNKELSFNIKIQDIYTLGSIGNITKNIKEYSSHELEKGII